MGATGWWLGCGALCELRARTPLLWVSNGPHLQQDRQLEDTLVGGKRRNSYAFAALVDRLHALIEYTENSGKYMVISLPPHYLATGLPRIVDERPKARFLHLSGHMGKKNYKKHANIACLPAHFPTY